MLAAASASESFATTSAQTRSTDDYESDEQDEATRTQYPSGPAQQSVPVDVRQDATHVQTNHVREVEYEAHEVRQLFREEPHEKFEHPASPNVPVSTQTSLPRSVTADEVSPARNQAQHEFSPLNLSTVVATPLRGSIPVAPDYPDSIAVDPCAPLPTGAVESLTVALPIPVLDLQVVDFSTLRPWRDVLLDPLGGVPLHEAVSVNLSAIGSEAEQFLSSVVSLGTEQPDGTDWSEYVWLAGGFALVCGGVQFARAIRARRVAANLHEPPEQPEEAE